LILIIFDFLGKKNVYIFRETPFLKIANLQFYCNVFDLKDSEMCVKVIRLLFGLIDTNN